MTGGEKLLSDDEMEAIEEMVTSGDLAEQGFNVNVAADKYDITLEGGQKALNTNVLGRINERFHRQLRASLLRELKFNASVLPGKIDIVRYADYIDQLSQPVSLSITKTGPLQGEALCMIDAQVVFSCVDNWFGGIPRSLDTVAKDRAFTSMEQVVIKKLRVVIYAALIEAWSDVFRIQCEFLRSESNPLLVNIAADNDLMVVNRFIVSGPEGELGPVDMVFPFKSLKLIRAVLNEAEQAMASSDSTDKNWQNKLTLSLNEVPFELVVKAGELPVSLLKLQTLKVGDVIPFKAGEKAEISVNGMPIFRADVGRKGDNAAAKIIGNIMSGDNDE